MCVWVVRQELSHTLSPLSPTLSPTLSLNLSYILCCCSIGRLTVAELEHTPSLAVPRKPHVVQLSVQLDLVNVHWCIYIRVRVSTCCRSVISMSKPLLPCLSMVQYPPPPLPHEIISRWGNRPHAWSIDVCAQLELTAGCLQDGRYLSGEDSEGVESSPSAPSHQPGQRPQTRRPGELSSPPTTPHSCLLSGSWGDNSSVCIVRDSRSEDHLQHSTCLLDSQLHVLRHGCATLQRHILPMQRSHETHRGGMRVSKHHHLW